jgi:hypothetical protein
LDASGIPGCPKRNSFWGTSACDISSYDQTHRHLRATITNVTRDAIYGLLGAGQSERAIVRQLGVSKGSIGRAATMMPGLVAERMHRCVGSYRRPSNAAITGPLASRRPG